MKLEWMERALDMARLIGMTDLAPAQEIFIDQFKPVPTTGLSRERARPLAACTLASGSMSTALNRIIADPARLALLALVLGAWEVLPRTGIVNPLLLPPLSRRAGDARKPARPPAACTRRSRSRRPR